jgi:medium-chain acyl-[acyl-carrier-protein] hydrolase
MRAVNKQQWCVCLHRAASPRFRIICFPYAGAGVSVFRPWATMVPPWLDLYGLQPPGRENRVAEPLCSDLEEIVRPASEIIRELSDDGVPTVFFGHSLGALVAYCVAERILRQGGLVPRHLVVSACSAPHRRGVIPPIHELPDSSFIEWLSGLGGTPQQVWSDLRLREMVLPVLRADFRLFASFDSDRVSRITTPITAFGGFDDGAVPYDGLAAWRDLTSGDFAHFMLPGDHFFLNSARQLLVSRIVRILSKQHDLHSGSDSTNAPIFRRRDPMR